MSSRLSNTGVMLLVYRSGADSDRKELRLSAIWISWILFLYTFISRMTSNFGPSQIGISKPGSLPTILSPVEAAHITRLCWTEGSTLSKTETIASGVFVVGGSLFVSVVSASTLILTLLARRLPDVVRRLKHSITPRAKVRNMNLRGRHVSYCYLISFCGKLRSGGES